VELNLLDLSRNFKEEIERILSGLDNKSRKELEEEVFHAREYHLCRSCREVYRKNPFGKHPARKGASD